jgi:hypothetical protein
LNIEPKPTEIVKNENIFNKERNLYIYDLKKEFEEKTSFDMNVKHDKSSVISKKKNIPLVKVHRYVTGTNQFNLGLKTVFENPLNDVLITYLENIPWYFKVYLHTLKIKYENSDEMIKPSELFLIVLFVNETKTNKLFI